MDSLIPDRNPTLYRLRRKRKKKHIMHWICHTGEPLDKNQRNPKYRPGQKTKNSNMRMTVMSIWVRVLRTVPKNMEKPLKSEESVETLPTTILLKSTIILKINLKI